MNKEPQVFTCPYAKKCGGCQMQNLTYPEQLRWKQRTVEKLLRPFGNVSPILGMENPYHYRGKVQAAFGVNKSGNVISGVYQSGTHRIVPVDSCLIEDEEADDVIVAVRRLLPSFKIAPYQEDKGTGILRHVLVKRSFSTGELMVVLVTAGPILPSRQNFIKALLKEHPGITTVVQNINPGRTNLVLGKREQVLYGPGVIRDKLCGFSFRISPSSFYQVNPCQTEVLYHTAIRFAGLTGKETALDAYCGTGTIGIAASPHAKNVIGVELNQDAVRDAIANAKENQVKNIRFFCADAGDFMKELAAGKEKVDLVFMDPPRAGASEAFLSSLIALSPQKAVYVSCNPETLSRDLKVLTKGGYQVQAIQPVDMFPFTHHVECVTLMTRK